MTRNDFYNVLTGDGWSRHPQKWYVYRKGDFSCHIGHPKGKEDECIASILTKEGEPFCSVIETVAYLKIQSALISHLTAE